MVKDAFVHGRGDGAIEHARPLLERRAGWYFEIGIAARAAVVLGRVDAAQEALSALDAFPSGAIRADAQLVRAMLAARDGDELGALAGFRAAISTYRDLGLRFDIALAGLAMAQVLPGSTPAVRSAVEEATSIAEDLGAVSVLRMLAEATAEHARPSAHSEVTARLPLVPDASA